MKRITNRMFLMLFPIVAILCPNILIAQSINDLQICCLKYDRQRLSFFIENIGLHIVEFNVPSSLKINSVDIINDYTITNDTIVINLSKEIKISTSRKIDYYIDGECILERKILPKDKFPLGVAIRKHQFKRLSCLKIQFPENNMIYATIL